MGLQHIKAISHPEADFKPANEKIERKNLQARLTKTTG